MNDENDYSDWKYCPHGDFCPNDKKLKKILEYLSIREMKGYDTAHIHDIRNLIEGETQ